MLYMSWLYIRQGYFFAGKRVNAVSDGTVEKGGSGMVFAFQHLLGQ
jgi:hypothetical protein